MKEIFERLYRENKTLWTVKEPPKELVELVESGKLTQGKVLDVGCGEGYHSVYLAKHGFDVIGVDCAETAILRAIQNAKTETVKCRFIVHDVMHIDELNGQFDFILEWGLMHLLMPAERQQYLEGIRKVLKPKGMYLSASFSYFDQALGGSLLKYRLAPASDLWFYYSSHSELKQLFSRFFRIIDSKLISLLANNGYGSVSNYFLMQNGGQF